MVSLGDFGKSKMSRPALQVTVRPRRGAKRERERIDVIVALGKAYDAALKAKADKTKINKLYAVHKGCKDAGMEILAERASDMIAAIKNGVS